MTGLIPHPGKPSRVGKLLPLTEALDTKEIAWRIETTEAAVANGIANARERERGE